MEKTHKVGLMLDTTEKVQKCNQRLQNELGFINVFLLVHTNFKQS